MLIRPIGDTRLSFSALRNRIEDFEAEKLAKPRGFQHIYESTHTTDIRPRPLVALNLDHAQMGVGGDDSWGAHTLDKIFLVGKPNMSLRFDSPPFQPSRMPSFCSDRATLVIR